MTGSLAFNSQGYVTRRASTVEYYDCDATLATRVAQRITANLAADIVSVIVATRRHQAQILQALRHGRGDPRSDRRCVFLDADELLAELLVDGSADLTRFRQFVGTPIARGGLRGAHLWVYCELSGILFDSGLRDAARRIESFWDSLSEHFDFERVAARRRRSVESATAHTGPVADHDQPDPALRDAAILESTDFVSFDWPRGPRQGELDLGITAAMPVSAATDIATRAAERDAATLPTRSVAERHLDQLLRRARMQRSDAIVLYVNIDRFSQVAEMLGHVVAQQMLEHTADRISGCFDHEHPVLRLGNDEFLVALEGPDLLTTAPSLAHRIVMALHGPFDTGRRRVALSASVGVAAARQGDSDAETLLRHARIAMRGAKQRGGNDFSRFDPGLEAAVRERFDLEQRLPLALEKREFIAHYQPTWNLGTGEIESLEALVRWQPPDGPIVSPARFIPVAEETGLIGPLGEWVLHSACMEGRRLQQSGFPDLQIAVNFSARQLCQPRVAARVQRILQETGFEPEQLVLELTESILVEDTEDVRAALWSLKALGVRLALDDFGTGYSGLAYLKRMPVDTLKIDQSFIRDIGKDRESEALVRSMLAIGQSMHLHVIAEGVETESQLAFLVANGCHAVQGFLLGRPAPIDALRPTLQTSVALARQLSLSGQSHALFSPPATSPGAGRSVPPGTRPRRAPWRTDGADWGTRRKSETELAGTAVIALPIDRTGSPARR